MASWSGVVMGDGEEGFPFVIFCSAWKGEFGRSLRLSFPKRVWTRRGPADGLYCLVESTFTNIRRFDWSGLVRGSHSSRHGNEWCRAKVPYSMLRGG